MLVKLGLFLLFSSAPFCHPGEGRDLSWNLIGVAQFIARQPSAQASAQGGSVSG